MAVTFKGVLLQRTNDFHFCERGDRTRSVSQSCRRSWVDLSKVECPVAVLLGNICVIKIEKPAQRITYKC